MNNIYKNYNIPGNFPALGIFLENSRGNFP